MPIIEQEKDALRSEAKQILEKFAKSIEGIKIKQKKDKKELSGFRENSNMKTDSDFRGKMFENAPQSDENFIITEKKKW
jgi:Asp-tRNA(Asn)/Glu-tRNA(Gln) amidotransferase C subunit